jgi:hypothetical protein
MQKLFVPLRPLIPWQAECGTKQIWTRLAIGRATIRILHRTPKTENPNQTSSHAQVSRFCRLGRTRYATKTDEQTSILSPIFLIQRPWPPPRRLIVDECLTSA